MTVIDDQPVATSDGIEPGRLAACLAVLAEAEQLPVDHPDALVVQRATGKLYKIVKERRRAERRAAILAADAQVTARTATGASTTRPRGCRWSPRPRAPAPAP
jgi:hypothetical protein